MKNIKYFVLFSVIISVVLTSCDVMKDFLKEESYRTDYTYYQSDAGLEALVGACYQQTRWYASSETQYAFEEIGTDTYMSGADGGHRDAYGEYQSHAMTPQNGNLSGHWNNHYSGIASCNLALQYLKSNTTLKNKDIRLGEVLFLRALYYYDLAIQFGDIPLVIEPVDKPKTDFVRAPQAEVWARIIADLRQAYELLPWASADGRVTGDYGRASKGAAGHLLAKAYLFRFGQTVAGTQSVSQMQENRGAKATDIDSVIYYAAQVTKFGPGAGSGSPHVLEPDLSRIWAWEPGKGMVGGKYGGEYYGPEIIFSVQLHPNPFYNNQGSPTDVNGGGNQLWMYSSMFVEGYPPTTISELGAPPIPWATALGLQRDKVNVPRPWRRFTPTKFTLADDGLYGSQAYTAGKPGKLIDSRLYKSHLWMFRANTQPSNVTWGFAGAVNNEPTYGVIDNAAGYFDPREHGHAFGKPRYGVGDTAMLLSVENLDKRFPNGTRQEKLALARSMEPYFYIPMFSIRWVQNRGQSGEREDMSTNAFPTLIKHLSNYMTGTNDQAEAKNFIRMRLAETYIMLSEAYARKGDWANAASALNVVRERAAWKEGELKHAQFWKYDGGTWADREKSTVEDMRVTGGFLSALTGGTALTDFFVDEYGRELLGELTRFSILSRYGADYLVNRVKAHNWLAAPNIKPQHRFRPIPQTHVDIVDPPDPNAQNYGY